METWDTFAVITGGAAAALAGLLFVAVSINAHTVGSSLELRRRAVIVLSLYSTVFLISVLIVIPGQSYRTLGAELIVLAVVAAFEVKIFGYEAGPTLGPGMLTSLLLLGAGLVLVFGMHVGLYVLVLPVVVALGFGGIRAWGFLVRIW